MKLENKTAVVTGGGSGIGLATAILLAEEGCQVLIAGRREQRLNDALASAPSPDRMAGQPADIANREDVRKLFATAERLLGHVDILVNAAGINVPHRAIGQLGPEDWDRVIRVNATGTFNCMQAVLPEMRARGNGLIINVSSIAGNRGDVRGGAAYSAAKFAQTGLGMTVGAEIADEGVRITTISPGETNTPILDDRAEPPGAEHRAKILQPEDVAAAIVMVACLHPRARVPELVITPTFQPYV
jgi:NAD(P)-dependent dehydrogenase (short-subunit alcohol dehydrogenase family)